MRRITTPTCPLTTARARRHPTVFHLLGRVSASPDYVITEEDTLEFFTSMQSESKRPNVLLDELKASHLLLIGNSFPDWLTRFFIRIAKSGRLSLQREELEIVADRRTHRDRDLVLFLKNFSYRTQIFEQGGAADFVRELSTRYLAKHPATKVAGEGRGASALRVHPQTRTLASGGTAVEAVALWDTESHERLLTLGTKVNVLSSLMFSPDGSVLAGGATSGLLYFWRAPTWAEIQKAEAADTTPTATPFDRAATAPP